jgi:ABC-type multidrug transport system ATPase subunit
VPSSGISISCALTTPRISGVPDVSARRIGEDFRVFSRRWVFVAELLTRDRRRVAQTLQPAPASTEKTGHAQAAIAVSGLVKLFGTTRALDGLDLTVRSGEVHGFLGPNGAGKTTTVRVLLGLLRKDGGEAAVLGGDPWRDAVALHRRLAYVPGEVNLWPNLTGGEVIDLLGRLRGGLDPKRRADLLERFQLDPTKKIRAYSKGNRQKVALVAAFASDVALYLLDEPTSGLDPLMEIVFQEVVRDLRNAGRTVLLSSHILAEVEALCDRVTIIRAGRATETGTFDELRHLTRTTIVVETVEPVGTLSDLPGVHDVRVDLGRTQFSVDTGELNHILEHLVEYGVRALTSSPPTLEELFLRHYGEDIASLDEDVEPVGAR